MRRIIMDSELVAHAGFFTDAVKRDPGPGCVRNIIVVVVPRGPSRHRALFHAINETTVPGLPEERNKVFAEIQQVLIHGEVLVASDKSADSVDSQQNRRVEYS